MPSVRNIRVGGLKYLWANISSITVWYISNLTCPFVIGINLSNTMPGRFCVWRVRLSKLNTEVYTGYIVILPYLDSKVLSVIITSSTTVVLGGS